MKLLMTCFLFSISITLAASQVLAKQPQITDEQITVEARNREIALEMARIKSSHSLYEYLSITPEKYNPLNKLSLKGRAQFIESLTFGERGLSGFDYSVLEKELSYSEIYQVLSLFGMQHTTKLLSKAKIKNNVDKMIFNSENKIIEDHKDYQCESRGTCSWAANKICTSNC